VNSFAIAKELGFEGVQVTYDPNPNAPDSLANRANRPRFLAAAKEAGVDIASFCIGQLNNSPLATTPEAEGWIEDCLNAMEEMDVPQVLLPFFVQADLDTQENRRHLPIIIEKLKRLATIAERKKKILAIENWLSAEANIGLVSAIGSEAVKVYYDTHNTWYKGFDIYHEIDLLASRKLISEIHLKDDPPLGEGEIDFPRVIALLEKHGFEGWLIFEIAPGVTIDAWRESHAANARSIKRWIGRDTVTRQ
jgi:sugar phosphate isomerase/epimerase